MVNLSFSGMDFLARSYDHRYSLLVRSHVVTHGRARMGLPHCFVPLGTLAGFLFVSVKQLSLCDKSTAERRGLIIQAVAVSPSEKQDEKRSSFFDDVLLLFAC